MQPTKAFAGYALKADGLNIVGGVDLAMAQLLRTPLSIMEIAEKERVNAEA